MTDLDFDELDRAVNSILDSRSKKTNKSTQENSKPESSPKDTPKGGHHSDEAPREYPKIIHEKSPQHTPRTPDAHQEAPLEAPSIRKRIVTPPTIQGDQATSTFEKSPEPSVEEANVEPVVRAHDGHVATAQDNSDKSVVTPTPVRVNQVSRQRPPKRRGRFMDIVHPAHAAMPAPQQKPVAEVEQREPVLDTAHHRGDASRTAEKPEPTVSHQESQPTHTEQSVEKEQQVERSEPVEHSQDVTKEQVDTSIQPEESLEYDKETSDVAESQSDIQTNRFHMGWSKRVNKIDDQDESLLTMPGMDDSGEFEYATAAHKEHKYVDNDDPEIDAELDAFMESTYEHNDIEATSPFLPDVKVEKRPLGETTITAAATATAATIKKDNHSDAVNEKEDTQKLHTNTPQDKTQSAGPEVLEKEPRGPVSHYNEVPGSIEQTSSKVVKKSLKIEHKKSNSVWVWVIGVIILLLVGVALGAVAFLVLNGNL